MTGAEFAELRTRLGYTQGALAQLLKLSTAGVFRIEQRVAVPEEYAAALQALPPAPAAAGRGAYRKETPATRRKPARPVAPRTRPVAPAAKALPGEARVYEPGELGEVELGAFWLGCLLLLGIARHLQQRAHEEEQRAFEEEVDAAFARLHMRGPRVPAVPRPPPLPPRGPYLCHRCGTWL